MSIVLDDWLEETPEVEQRFVAEQIDEWDMKSGKVVFKNKRKSSPPDLTQSYGDFVSATASGINLLDYKELVEKLIAARKENFSTEVCTNEYELSEHEKDLLGIFRYASDENFRRVLYLRIGKKCATYKMVGVQNGHNNLGFEDALIGAGLYTEYKQKYQKLCNKLAKDGSLLKNIFGASLNSNEDGGTQPHILPFSTYLERIQPLFMRCEDFRISMPVTISNHPEEAAFYHFNPDSLTPGDWSEWQDWMECMDVVFHDVFMAYIYSIFVKNDGRQALWLHGEGMDGKSKMIGAVTQYRQGVGVGSVSKGSLDSNFGYSYVYGRNLLTYGDCKNPKFIRSTMAHSILGGDYVPIEYKNQQPFYAWVHAKMLIASNMAPEINTSETNERTRLIYIPLHKPSERVLKKFCKINTDGDLEYDAAGNLRYINYDLQGALFRQMSAFLYECKSRYEELCPGDGNILLPDEMIDVVSNVCGSHDELLNETYVAEFISFDDPFATVPLLRLEKHYTTLHKCNGLQYGSLKRLLQNEGAKIKRIRNNKGQRINCWCGITLRDKPLSGHYDGGDYTGSIVAEGEEDIV